MRTCGVFFFTLLAFALLLRWYASRWTLSTHKVVSNKSRTVADVQHYYRRQMPVHCQLSLNSKAVLHLTLDNGARNGVWRKINALDYVKWNYEWRLRCVGAWALVCRRALRRKDARSARMQLCGYLAGRECAAGFGGFESLGKACRANEPGSAGPGTRGFTLQFLFLTISRWNFCQTHFEPENVRGPQETYFWQFWLSPD